MKQTSCILIIFLISILSNGQIAMANYGELKMHQGAQLGIHIDLINEGNSLDNEGFTGFYNTNIPLTFSGSNQINFGNLEVAVNDDLLLERSMGITGDIFDTSGRIMTPRDDTAIRFKFLDDNNGYIPQTTKHVDGYVQFSGDFNFLFPIGDDFEVKPAGIRNFMPNSNFIAAFFKEDPNAPTDFATSFDTTSFEPSLDIVSSNEFWYFKSLVDVDLTLFWTASSLVNTISDDLGNLRIVAWDPSLEQWVNQGRIAISGNLTNGSITARIDNPELYTIYTIGSIVKAGADLFVYNALTPNGDGSNDTLIIRGIDGEPNNELQIFNRWGVKVYQKSNYDNSFDGTSEGRITVTKGEKLPTGTYFYILRLPERDDLSGYFYIKR